VGEVAGDFFFLQDFLVGLEEAGGAVDDGLLGGRSSTGTEGVPAARLAT